MSVEKRKPGLVCTFYSYKGGVGRSMALANVAVLLARLGQKVLVIDWDLEAPGLEQYFGPHHRATRRTIPGLVDFIASYGAERPLEWRECLLRATIPKGETVHILHAGREDPEYSDRLRSVNWDQLFEKGFGRYIENIRNEWKREYDYVFIDSRTGITDIGGICSILLPDYLLSLFTTNEQSVLGVKDAMTRARAAQGNLPLDRQRLIIIPIAARDESTTEYKRAAEWRKRFALELSGFYDDWIHKDETAESVLDYLKIPYIAYWSFGEQLPVLAEDETNPKTLAYSYALIARLIHSRLDWSEVREGRETSELQAQREAEAQIRLAEAAKVRTEALSQQQAESNKIFEQRKAALFKRADYLAENTRRKQRSHVAGMVAGAALAMALLLAMFYAHSAVQDGKFVPNYFELRVALSAVASAGLAWSVFCFFYFLRYRRIDDALQRENAAYTIGHGIYDQLSNEASLRLFGERIESIVQNLEQAGSRQDNPGFSDSASAPPVPARQVSGPSPLPLPPTREIGSGATTAAAVASPVLPLNPGSPIDVLLSYPREGIARDWALEFIPLFSRWLSEMLGRNALVFDAASLDTPERFYKASLTAHTAVAILSGRTRDMESAPELKILFDQFTPGRLFPLSLERSSRRMEGPLAHLKWMDFSDLAYIGEGFAKSERYIDFQDRVRALAQEVADKIEQVESQKRASPVA